MKGTIGLILLLSFLLVTCDPKGAGEVVHTFVTAAKGE